MRTTVLAAVAALALVLAPVAGAWTKLTPDTLQNIVDPAVVVLPSGTELIAYREPVAGTLKVIANGKTLTLAAGLPLVGDAQILAPRSGPLLLYAGENTGVVRYASSDGGSTWSGGTPIAGTTTGDVQAAALQLDGTPLFSQDGTSFLTVYTGLDGQAKQNVFPFCCGYAESLAVDSTGRAQIAFWSNATGQPGYLFGPVGGPFIDLTGGKQSLANDARVPLVTDTLGNTFVGWQTGYPDADAFVVTTYRAGAPTHTVRFTGRYAQPDPHMALSVDSTERLWAVWTKQGAVWAARSRSHGRDFGAAVHVVEPGSVYELEAGARPDGAVDVVANTGSNLQEQRLLPGLTVSASRTAVRVLDDGFPVAGASVVGGGKTGHTNGAGRASFAKKLKKGTLLRVSAGGYTPTSARVP